MKQMSLAVVAAALLVVGCSGDPKSGEGFSLPDGDPVRGQKLFVDFGCPACHTIAGEHLAQGSGPVTVELGGQVTRVKTYGELVSSVINPSHKLPTDRPVASVSRDGQSLMRVYNDVMTVSQLIDLVAFLSSSYEVVGPRVKYEDYSYERWAAERE